MVMDCLQCGLEPPAGTTQSQRRCMLPTKFRFKLAGVAALLRVACMSPTEKREALP